MKHLNIFIISIFVALILFSCTTKNQFSSYSETEQEELYAELSDRLDQYFIPTIQYNLMAFLFISALDDTNVEDAMLEKISFELLDICEQWAADYNIDFEDWANKYAEDFSTYYVIHLLQLAGELEQNIE